MGPRWVRVRVNETARGGTHVTATLWQSADFARNLLILLVIND